MALSKWRRREELRKRAEGPIPTAPSGRPYHAIRCFKCQRILALTEIMPSRTGLQLWCRFCKIQTPGDA
jgi:hypothetical protein